VVLRLSPSVSVAMYDALSLSFPFMSASVCIDATPALSDFGDTVGTIR
jgi:hypothetical protein